MYKLPQQPEQELGEGRLVTGLEEALSTGNIQHAGELAKQLAVARVRLSVKLLSMGPLPSHQQFRLDVMLESPSQPDFGLIPLQVSSAITVFGLKVKMAVLYRIPPQCQRWIIGKKIPQDNETLRKLGITRPTRVFLYVIEAKALKLDRGKVSDELENLKRFHGDVVKRGGNPDLELVPIEYERFIQERTHQERFWHLDHKSTRRRVRSWSGGFVEVNDEIGDESGPPAPVLHEEMQDDRGFVIIDRSVSFNTFERPSTKWGDTMGAKQRHQPWATDFGEDTKDTQQLIQPWPIDSGGDIKGSSRLIRPIDFHEDTKGTQPMIQPWAADFAEVNVELFEGSLPAPVHHEEVPGSTEIVIAEDDLFNSLEAQTGRPDGELAVGYLGDPGDTGATGERMESWANGFTVEDDDPFNSLEVQIGGINLANPRPVPVMEYRKPPRGHCQREATILRQLRDCVPYLPLNETGRKKGRKVSQKKIEIRREKLTIEVLQAEGYSLKDCHEAIKECGTDLDRARNYFKECGVCYTVFPMSKITGNMYCQCPVCTECFTQHYTVLAQSTPCMYKYVCPVCQHPGLETFQADAFQDYFGLLGTMLQQHLNGPDYDLYQSKMINWGLMKEENFRWCVHGCGNGFINERQQKKLQCPSCRKHQCFECKKPWLAQHDNISCEEFDAWKRTNDPEFQQLGLAAHLKENGINCPKCKMRYELAKGGCMHFTCPQCQHEFCCGCNLPFVKYPDCRVSKSCKDKGLHAHHPRDCLYHLRDHNIGELQQVLQSCGIDFTPPKAAARVARASVCPVRLQLETKGGLVDNNCGRPVKARSGLCELHYKEYLVSLINQHKIDPVDVFTEDQMGRVLARHDKQLPQKQRRETSAAYQARLRQTVKELIPLN